MKGRQIVSQERLPINIKNEEALNKGKAIIHQCQDVEDGEVGRRNHSRVSSQPLYCCESGKVFNSNETMEKPESQEETLATLLEGIKGISRII